MRVFISSVLRDFDEYRKTARRAIALAGHEAFGFEDFAASSHPSQQACLDGVRQSDVYVGIFASRYGATVASGKSPTHEEFDHAQRCRIPRLIFVQSGVDRDAALNTMLEEAGSYETGVTWKTFGDQTDLFEAVASALKTLSDTQCNEPPPDLPAIAADSLVTRPLEDAAHVVLVAVSPDAMFRPAHLGSDASQNAIVDAIRRAALQSVRNEHAIDPQPIRKGARIDALDRNRRPVARFEVHSPSTAVVHLKIAEQSADPMRGVFSGLFISPRMTEQAVRESLIAADAMLEAIDTDANGKMNRPIWLYGELANCANKSFQEYSGQSSISMGSALPTPAQLWPEPVRVHRHAAQFKRLATEATSNLAHYFAT